ncbi:MAG TPA: PAS domain-containing protein [Candidatus Acidoferrum sp.]|nr:PAS domain-containing protein [Candidatus Acidoferrum sp.]
MASEKWESAKCSGAPGRRSFEERTIKRNRGRSAGRALFAPRANSAANAFEKLLSLHERVELILKSDGTVGAVVVPDLKSLDPDCTEFVGRRLRSVLGKETYRVFAPYLQTFLQAHTAQEFGYLFDLPDGRRWFSILVTRVPKRKDSRLFSPLATDATRWEEADRQLKRVEALLAHAEEAGEIGTWEADLETGEVALSEHLRRTLAVAPGDVASLCGLLRTIAGSCCREQPATNHRDSLEAIDHEVLYMRLDGAARTLHVRAIPVECKLGMATRFVGAVRDVTDRKREKERLLASEAIIAQAKRMAGLGSWHLDATTRQVIWSEQCSHLLGTSLSDGASNQSYWDSLHVDDRERVSQILEQAILESKECEYVARYRLPNGRWRIHHTRGVPICSLDGKTTRMLGVVQDITDQTRVEGDLRRLSQQLMRTRDEERRQMARELHESAGQSLAALKMTLGNLRETLPRKGGLASSLLRTCVDLTEEAIREVRTVSYLMHPPMLNEAGLGSALRWYAKGFSERSNIQVDVEAPRDFGRLPSETELTLFRVVQEALTNVHRYSGSRIARIRIVRELGRVVAEVGDDGCGIPQPSHSNGRSQPMGVGIAGMRERVHELNGVFEINSTPGRGTTVRVVLPVLTPHDDMVASLDRVRGAD